MALQYPHQLVDTGVSYFACCILSLFRMLFRPSTTPPATTSPSQTTSVSSMARAFPSCLCGTAWTRTRSRPSCTPLGPSSPSSWWTVHLVSSTCATHLTHGSSSRWVLVQSRQLPCRLLAFYLTLILSIVSLSSFSVSSPSDVSVTCLKTPLPGLKTGWVK